MEFRPLGVSKSFDRVGAHSPPLRGSPIPTTFIEAAISVLEANLRLLSEVVGDEEGWVMTNAGMTICFQPEKGGHVDLPPINLSADLWGLIRLCQHNHYDKQSFLVKFNELIGPLEDEYGEFAFFPSDAVESVRASARDIANYSPTLEVIVGSPPDAHSTLGSLQTLSSIDVSMGSSIPCGQGGAEGLFAESVDVDSATVSYSPSNKKSDTIANDTWNEDMATPLPGTPA